MMIGDETIRVGCVLEGDSAIDFERLVMECKVATYASTRPKQQSLLISVALLVLDSGKRSCAAKTGERYPSIEEVLRFHEVSEKDIVRLLGATPHDQNRPEAAITDGESSAA